jgi:membrane protease YdiL (CAAX protease family)
MPTVAADISAAPPVDSAAVVWAALIALAVAASSAVLGVILSRWRQGLPVVPRREHEPVPWNGFDVLQVLVLHFVVISLGLSGVRSEHGPGKLIPLDLLAKLVATAFGIAYLVARGASLGDLGLAPLRPAADLRIAAAGVALLVAPLLALAGLLNILVPYAHPVIDFMRLHRDPWSIAMVTASAVVAAPLAEEFFFRRVLQGWLEKRLPDHDARAAVAVAAALFAFAHVGQGLAFVPLLPLGLVLGFIARRTGSIVPCILLHALFNAVSVALLVWQTAAPAAA